MFDSKAESEKVKCGKVTKVKDDNEIEVEIATGVKVRVVQSTIASVVSKTEPAEG